MIKLSRGNLLREKSVTLANLSFPRETVNKSSFPRTKPCSVTTAIVMKRMINLKNNTVITSSKRIQYKSLGCQLIIDKIW